MHGKTSEIHHDGQGIFAGLPNPFVATRYHSLVVDPDSVPDALTVTATATDGVIMGLRHRELPIEGVQFHPESVLTVSGPALLGNFLAQLAGVPARPERLDRLRWRPWSTWWWSTSPWLKSWSWWSASTAGRRSW